MIQDAHTEKISLPLAVTGSVSVVAAKPDAWIYVHEIIGDLTITGTLEILAGTTSLAKFTLDAGQGLTIQDQPGMDGVPRFKVPPTKALVFTITGGGQFDGAIDFSYRY